MRLLSIAVLILCTVLAAPAAEFSAGIEMTQFKADLERSDQPDTDNFIIHDNWTQAVARWGFSQGLAVRAGVGVSGSLLEQIDSGTGNRTERGGTGGFLFSIGLGYEKLLGNTLLLLDLSYANSSVDWEDSGDAYEYNDVRTAFTASVGFTKSEQVLPYVGLSFIMYDSERIRNDVMQAEYENEDMISFVLGVRTQGTGLAAGAEFSFGAETRFSLSLTVPF